MWFSIYFLEQEIKEQDIRYWGTFTNINSLRISFSTLKVENVKSRTDIISTTTQYHIEPLSLKISHGLNLETTPAKLLIRLRKMRWWLHRIALFSHYSVKRRLVTSFYSTFKFNRLFPSSLRCHQLTQKKGYLKSLLVTQRILALNHCNWAWHLLHIDAYSSAVWKLSTQHRHSLIAGRNCYNDGYKLLQFCYRLHQSDQQKRRYQQQFNQLHLRRTRTSALRSTGAIKSINIDAIPFPSEPLMAFF